MDMYVNIEQLKLGLDRIKVSMLELLDNSQIQLHLPPRRKSRFSPEIEIFLETPRRERPPTYTWIKENSEKELGLQATLLKEYTIWFESFSKIADKTLRVLKSKEIERNNKFILNWISKNGDAPESIPKAKLLFEEMIKLYYSIIANSPILHEVDIQNTIETKETKLMTPNDQIIYVANAFVSCSLRTEDINFINHVESILRYHSINPFGTVGRYSAAPVNPSELMKTNIQTSDMVVIVATPRYEQKDIQTGRVTHGLSEMIHVESGMAEMAGKPVVVFVQAGTNVGNYLPNITQYITLNGSLEDFQNKLPLIRSLLQNAYNIVCKHRVSAKQRQEQAANESFKNGLIWAVAGLGTYAFFDYINSEDKSKADSTS